MKVTEGSAGLRTYAVRGLFWSALQRTGSQAIGLVAFVLLSRLLPPSAFGVLAMANVYLLAVLLLVEHGVSQAIVQRGQLEGHHLDAALGLSVVLSVLLMLLTIGLAAPLASLFREPLLEPVLRWLSPTILLSGLRATQIAILQRQLRFRELAIRSTVSETFAGIVGIGMASVGLGVWSLVGQALARGAVGVMVLWSVSGWRPRPVFRIGPAREIVSFGLPVLADRLVALVMGKADDLAIGLALGTTALGHYSVGYRGLTYLTMLIAGTVQPIAFTVLSRLQAEPERFRRVFLTTVHYLCLGGFPVFVVVAFVAPFAVPLALGPNWSEAVPVIQILSLAGAAKLAGLPTSTALVAAGRPGTQLRLNSAITLLSLLGFAAVVRSGIAAVALVHLAAGLLAIPVNAVVLRRAFDIQAGAYLAANRLALVGVLLMSAVLGPLAASWAGQIPTPLALLGAVVVGSVVYLGTTFFLGRGSYVRARHALGQGFPAEPIVIVPETEAPLP